MKVRSHRLCATKSRTRINTEKSMIVREAGKDADTAGIPENEGDDVIKEKSGQVGRGRVVESLESQDKKLEVDQVEEGESLGVFKERESCGQRYRQGR